MSETVQVWKIPVSPAQRWQLYILAHAETIKLRGQEGRRYRRFLSAFGIKGLSPIVQENGSVSETLAKNSSCFLHEVTAENLDYLKRIRDEVPRSALQEDILGDLFDCIDDLKEGYVHPELPSFDPSVEDWTRDE